jgi:hypothetical protein
MHAERIDPLGSYLLSLQLVGFLQLLTSKQKGLRASPFQRLFCLQ